MIYSIQRYVLCFIIGFTLIHTIPVYGKADITFSGNVDYMVQYNYINTTNINGGDSSASPDFRNAYAWNMALAIQSSEHLLFGIRISNPSGYFTDIISENTLWSAKKESKLLEIPELYFIWQQNIISISAGIIPVFDNTILSLVAYESQTLGYSGIGTYSWKELMNNSQKGLDFSLSLLNETAYTVSVNFISAMAQDAPGTDRADAFLFDKMRFILSFPTTFANKTVSFLPLLHVKVNAFRSADHEQADHSISGGCDVAYAPFASHVFRFGAAGGLFHNKSQEGDSVKIKTSKDSVLIQQISPLGVLLSAGYIYQPKFGKLTLDFRFGRTRDRSTSPVVNENLFFGDINYTLPLKQISLIPRFRIWYQTNDNTAAAITTMCPELKLSAEF